MKTITQIAPHIFVAPEIDGRGRHIRPLSCAIQGFRLVVPVSGSPFVASFEALGWSKLHDVTDQEAAELGDLAGAREIQWRRVRGTCPVLFS